MEVDLPKVPLEAGLGPENPPCPICGEPIFPWLELPGGAGLAGLPACVSDRTFELTAGNSD